MHQAKALFAILIQDNVEPFEIDNSWSCPKLWNQAVQKVYMCFGVDLLDYCLRKRKDGISYLKPFSRSGVDDTCTNNGQERRLFVLYQQSLQRSMSSSSPTAWTFLRYPVALGTSWLEYWGQKTSIKRNIVFRRFYGSNFSFGERTKWKCTQRDNIIDASQRDDHVFCPIQIPKSFGIRHYPKLSA